MSTRKPIAIWKDRELRFDQPVKDMEARDGEEIFATFTDVRDTKGNDNEPGQLRVSNLRLTWTHGKKPKVNISMGLKCIVSIKKDAKFIKLLVSYNGSRFEFIFTPPAEDLDRAVKIAAGVRAAYNRSKPARDVMVRAKLLREGQLRLLPDETVYSRLENVYNLGSGDTVPGVMIVTNMRVVWYGIVKQEFNVSLPYLQTEEVKTTVSEKYGDALAISMTEGSGGYRMGFKIQPVSNLETACKDIATFWQSYLSSPILSLQFDPENPDKALEGNDSDAEGDAEEADGQDPKKAKDGEADADPHTPRTQPEHLPPLSHG